MSKDYNEYSCGMVYIMTNSAECNQIAAFYRKPDGTLSLNDFYNTQGKGTGPREISPATPNDGIDPLASQGSLRLSNNRHFLLAVNAGSNTISCFRVLENGDLLLTDVVPSGGVQPNSLCVKDSMVYVTNVGDKKNDFQSNITGLYINTKGKLTRVPYSSYSLSTPNAQPSCINFSPDGKQLIVSELTTNRLSVYPIYKNKIASCPTVNTSNGAGPFGSAFTCTDKLVVAEAGANALSSYEISSNGLLEVISGSIKNGQQATCWVSITPDSKYAYTSNTGSRTVSFYRVCPDGALDYIESINSTSDCSDMGAPIDNGISSDGQNFYVLNGNKGTISVFGIQANGYLDRLQEIGSREIPKLGTQGLAVI